MRTEEPWPGAGVEIAFDYTLKRQADRIVAHVEKLTPRDAIFWIDLFFMEFRERVPREDQHIAPELRERLKILKNKMGQRILLEASRELAKEASDKPEETDSPAARAAGKLGQVKSLTAAQRVGVFRFLSDAAGMKADELYKTDIARFIFAATGSDPSKIYSHVQDPEQKTSAATYRDLTTVRSWFEKLKMDVMVKKVERERKNYGE